jgi:lipopolysaccharide assembly LptE-like protein
VRGRATATLGLALAALAATGCGYGFTTRYVARGGADRIHVRAFENRSTEPELGAAVTTALRDGLARRGAAAGAGASAFIDGEVRAGEPVVSVGGDERQPAPTWRIAVEVRARLVVAGAPAEQRVVRREADFLAGADPLESEGRRALALRRVAEDAAAEILRGFER